tara:strand:- start:88969 stop:89169 length:201 start_codon:yes stop_codon:yes gene_type:complete
MANKKLEVRLPRIMHAYLQDLADVGYGNGKTGVARRFIENAVTKALETGIIEKRKAQDFEGADDEE